MAELKNIKKGDKVILRMFTGAFVEAKVVEMADAKKIGFTTKNGVKMVFDKKTGKQVTPEPKAEKFANYIEVYDEAVEADEIAKKKKAAEARAEKAKEKAAKKAEAKEKAKEKAKATAKKSSKKAPEPEEDDDEYEEVDESDDDADEYEEAEEDDDDEYDGEDED